MLGIAPAVPSSQVQSSRLGGIVFLQDPGKQLPSAEEFGSFLSEVHTSDITLPIAATGVAAAPVAPPPVSYSYIPVGTRVVLRSKSDVVSALGDHFYDPDLLIPLCGYSHVGEVIESREKSLRARFAVQAGRLFPQAKASCREPVLPAVSVVDEEEDESKRSIKCESNPLESDVTQEEAAPPEPEVPCEQRERDVVPAPSLIPQHAAGQALAPAVDSSIIVITLSLPYPAVLTLCDFLLLGHQAELASLAHQQRHEEMIVIIDQALRTELAWASVVSNVGDNIRKESSRTEEERPQSLNSSASSSAAESRSDGFTGGSASASMFLRSLMDLIPPALQLYLGQPLTAPVLCLKALCQMSIGDVSHALRTAAAAVANDPTCAEGYLRVMECLILLNRDDEAAVTAATCVSNCPYLCDEFRSMWLAVRVLNFSKRRLDKADVEMLPNSGAGGNAAAWCHPLLRRQINRQDAAQELLARSVRCRATRKTKAGTPLIEDYASVLLTNGIVIPVPDHEPSSASHQAKAIPAFSSHEHTTDCGYCGFPLRKSKEEIIKEVATFSSGLANIVRKKYSSRSLLRCEGECGLVFCSEVCRDKAYVEFHELECAVPSRTKAVGGPVQQRRRTVDFSFPSTSPVSSAGRPSLSSPFFESSFNRAGGGSLNGRNSSLFAASGTIQTPMELLETRILPEQVPSDPHELHGSARGFSIVVASPGAHDGVAGGQLSADDGGKGPARVPVKPKGPSPMLVAMLEARRQSVTVSASSTTVEGIRGAIAALGHELLHSQAQIKDEHARNSLMLFSRTVTTILSIFFPCPLSMIHIRPDAASGPFVDNVIQNERQAQSGGITWDRTEIIKSIIKKCDEYGISSQHGLDSNFRHTFSNALRSEDSMSRSSGFIQMNDVDRNSLLLAEIVCHEVGIPFFSNPFLAPAEATALMPKRARRNSSSSLSQSSQQRSSPADKKPFQQSDLHEAFLIAQKFLGRVEEAIFSSSAQQSVAFSSASLAMQSSSGGSASSADHTPSSTPHSSRHDSKSTPSTSPARTPLALLTAGGNVARRNSSVWTIDEDGPASEQTVAPSVWKIGRLLAFFRSHAFLCELWDLVVTGQVIVRRSPLSAAVGPFVPEHLGQQWDACCHSMRTAHVALCPVLSTCSYITYGRSEEDRYVMPCKFPRTPPMLMSLISTRSAGLLSISSAHDLNLNSPCEDAVGGTSMEAHSIHHQNIEFDEFFGATGMPGRRGVRVVTTRAVEACEELALVVY